MLIAIIVCLSIALLAAIITIIILAHKLRAASDNMRKARLYSSWDIMAD